MKTTDLLSSLQRNHVEEAIRRLDAGFVTRFSDSIKYDLFYGGKRYPPKRVAGLALEIMSGHRFGPESFKGGEESSCFRALRRCGFTIVPKASAIDRTLTDAFKELLTLQRVYRSTNTPEMERRGLLVRKVIPDHIRASIRRFEPIFSGAGFSLGIEGSDGIGRKVESPWVRIFDELMSPSATVGWYVVLHFSRNGLNFFATAGCSATALRQGSLVHLPIEDLQRKVQWARDLAAIEGFPISSFQDRIDLQGNELSRQFERATAFARIYQVDTFIEKDFWDDLQLLCRLLVKLYEHERLGKAPLSDQPEVLTGLEAIEKAVSGRPGGAWGQGRNLSVAERVAIEERAMIVAHERLRAEGFSNITDVHKRESYDFTATRSESLWMVEVKGTTSSIVDSFLLTASELALHRLHCGRTALVLVYDIRLIQSEGGVSATGGTAELHTPWMVNEWTFEATAYRAKRSPTSPVSKLL